LSAGVFNSGYLGVGPEGDSAPFLDWWADRTARHCLSDTSRSQFVEQRWLSVAPGLFDLEVCRDPGANLMGWRLGAHDVDADTLTFLDRPVRTFHFCGGFDPDQPHRLATMPGLPWPEAPSRPGAVALCRGYARELLTAGFHAEMARPYRYAALPDGRPLDRFVRHAYLRGLVEAEAAGTSRPPTAFDGQFDRMLAWLAAPAQDVPLSRYHHELWRQRTDLQFAFPTAATTNPEPFERWIGQHPEHTQLAELRPSGH
ncbi:MAG: hypothetical protein H7233_08400, partial [Pseudorhodobacter sp.]|nr:hypothetical protein [Frankiaceae bacterium]